MGARAAIPLLDLAEDGDGPSTTLIDGDLFAIAGGIGPDGSWAAEEALRVVAAHVRANPSGDREIVVPEAVRLANRRIFEHGPHGAGCTIAVLSLRDVAVVAHVGDALVFRSRQGVLERLTEPHTLINDYGLARLKPEQIRDYKHVLVRALGMRAVEIDVRRLEFALEDLWLLADNELVEAIGESELRDLMERRGRELDECVAAILGRARALGVSTAFNLLMVRMADPPPKLRIVRDD